jgi:serine/threonine-protein kinase HipA
VSLSQSLPLRSEQFDQDECRGYFGGILPEADQRDTVAGNLGISKKNDFAMLEKIGGECAGAVTFMPAGQALPEDQHTYLTLDNAKLAEVLRKLPMRPLLAGEDGIRLSLAGAQTKLAVHKGTNGVLSIPLRGAPSTHILKPAVKSLHHVVFNEAFCMKLAQAVKLRTANCEIGHIEGIDYLLVERYDRRSQGSETVRLHQEDFCQALGIVSDNKYQNEGGPSLKNCFDLVRGVSSTPILDLQELLNATIFNFLIGNNDAHGKNFSLLYDRDASQERHISFAPTYDLICTIYYPDLSTKMAMKIGSQYEYEKVFPRHFEAMADEAGLSKPIVKQRVEEMIAKVLSALTAVEPLHSSSEEIVQLIRARCEKMQSRLKE